MKKKRRKKKKHMKTKKRKDQNKTIEGAVSSVNRKKTKREGEVLFSGYMRSALTSPGERRTLSPVLLFTVRGYYPPRLTIVVQGEKRQYDYKESASG